ncbi:MAG: YajQ family cyclic di-GMP-binding protein [Candidatus Omnitrophica bacterium CG12_big_fil_rev_8_21_14_0_65_50_5]|nr:MAG: YajQ family cyclic di-GMP-binding protein [Candidatus Omnitrophica bacterium CG12_big_fil_rev_8_21_14_0_65_50_5]
MAQFSFDIVSTIDLQEVDNAVNQTKKELSTRYDFKGSKSSIDLNKAEKNIKIIADDDMKLRSLQDILKTRIASRKISVKSLKFQDQEEAFEGTLRQTVDLVNGIPQDKAKAIVKKVKDERFKVQIAIQGEELRVTAKSKDELQGVMGFLKQAELDIPIQFTNFR